MNVAVLEGSKAVEVKNAGAHKGRAAMRWLSRQGWDFIFAAGDDHTDEDMFSALGEQAYSIKVGYSGRAFLFENIKMRILRQDKKWLLIISVALLAVKTTLFLTAKPKDSAL